MGVMATKAIQARRRSTVARIDRLIVARDAQDPQRMARNQRIKVATRDARTALRARAAADRARQTADARTGVGLRRLLDEGLSMSDAAVPLDISRSAAKRLIRTATEATGPGAAKSSTEPTDECATDGSGVHGEYGGTAISGARNEGNL